MQSALGAASKAARALTTTEFIAKTKDQLNETPIDFFDFKQILANLQNFV